MTKFFGAIGKIFHYFYVVLIGIPFLIFCYFAYFLPFTTHKEKYSLEKRYQTIRRIMRFYMALFRVKYDVEGYQRYLNHPGKCVIFSNHQSNLDAIILMCISEKPLCYVCKKEIEKYPIFGRLISSIDAIFIDRHNIMKQLDTIRQTVKQAKGEDFGNVVIYIEGTRNRELHGDVLEYKAGTVKTAYMSGVTILPIVTYGAFRILSLNYHLSSYPCYVRFLEPITSEEYKEVNTVDMAARLEKMTNETVDKLRLLDISYLKGSKNLPCDRERALTISYKKPIK